MGPGAARSTVLEVGQWQERKSLGLGAVNNFISFFNLHLNEPSSDWGTSGEPGALPETTHSAKAKSQDPWPPAGAPNRGSTG